MKIKFFNVTILTLAFIMNMRADIVKGSLLKSLLTNENLPIEHAQKNLLIQSLSRDKKLLARACVLATSFARTDNIIEVDLGDRRIQAATNQTFFDPILKRWIKAKDLTNQNSLLGPYVNGDAKKEEEKDEELRILSQRLEELNDRLKNIEKKKED